MSFQIRQIGYLLPRHTAQLKAWRSSPKGSLTLKTAPGSFKGALNAEHVRELVEKIAQKYPNQGLKVKTIGLSEGTNVLGKPQPILTVEIIPSIPAKKAPLIFTAGHHGDEYAGPHSCLHLLELFLEELTESKSNPQRTTQLRKFLEGRPLIFIPLANPDGAILREGDDCVSLGCFGPEVDAAGYIRDPNIYHTFPEGNRFYKSDWASRKKGILGGTIRPEAFKIREYLKEIFQHYGLPALAVDFHESNLVAGGSNNRRQKRYIFAPLEIVSVAKDYSPYDEEETVSVTYQLLTETVMQAIRVYGETISDLIIHGEPKRIFQHNNQRFLNLMEWIKVQNALAPDHLAADTRTFIIETPNSETQFHVGDRVTMAMMAMDEIIELVMAR